MHLPNPTCELYDVVTQAAVAVISVNTSEQMRGRTQRPVEDMKRLARSTACLDNSVVFICKLLHVMCRVVYVFCVWWDTSDILYFCLVVRCV